MKEAAYQTQKETNITVNAVSLLSSLKSLLALSLFSLRKLVEEYEWCCCISTFSKRKRKSAIL